MIQVQPGRGRPGEEGEVERDDPGLGAVQTAVVLNLGPVAVAFIAFLALGERLTAVQLMGAATVVSAVMYYQLAGRLAARAR